MTTIWTTDDLIETIEDLVRQFAYPTNKDGAPAYTAGGLSALEGAFAVLGWSDPYPIEGPNPVGKSVSR
jgi:hypothetical protein